MPGRMTRSAPQSPFELPEVRAVVRATRPSCQNAGKAQNFTPVRGSSGESRVKAKLAGLWLDKTALTDPSGEKSPRYIISDRPMTEEEWIRERCGE
jgi:hypothetical protein